MSRGVLSAQGPSAQTRAAPEVSDRTALRL